MTGYFKLSLPLRRIVFLAVNCSALVIIYLITVHPFLANTRQNSERIQDLQHSISRFRAVADREVGIKDLVAKAKTAPLSGEFWIGESEATTSAGLQARLRDMADASNVRLRSVRGLPASKQHGGSNLIIRIEATGDMSSIKALLSAIETETPFMFVTSLNLRQNILFAPNASQTEPSLDIQIDVSALFKDKSA